MDIQVSKTPNHKIKLTVSQDTYLCLYKKEIGKTVNLESVSLDDYEKLKEKVITRGKKRVFYLLARKSYTFHELLEKLKKSGYDEETAKKILDYFKSLNYVNDREYARKYVDDKKGSYSKRYIMSHLLKKGIAKDICEEILNEMHDEDTEYNSALKIATRKLGRYQSDDVRKKMTNHLLYKGYNYNIISKVLNEIKV